MSLSPEERAAKNAKRRERRTGFSRELYERLHVEQEGRCAICKKTSNKPLRGDHCHVTGRPRALLCFKCNYGIGMFNDNSDALISAAEYVRRFA